MMIIVDNDVYKNHTATRWVSCFGDLLTKITKKLPINCSSLFTKQPRQNKTTIAIANPSHTPLNIASRVGCDGADSTAGATQSFFSITINFVKFSKFVSPVSKKCMQRKHLQNVIAS